MKCRILVFLGLCSGLIAACGGTGSSPRIDPEAPPARDGETTVAPEAQAGGDEPGLAHTDAGAQSDARVTPPTKPAAVDPLAGITSVALVQDGFAYVEGPTWRAVTSEFLFSDIPNNEIMRFAPPSVFDTFRYPSGKSNGLTVDGQGRLVACESGSRRVSRTLQNGTIEVLAESYQGKRLNAPNDLIVRSDDTVYFTDPDYSIYGLKELDFNGVYRIAPDKTLSVVTSDLAKPNGIALSPDEKRLYVSDEASGFLRVYDLLADGVPESGRKLADVPHADGFAVDDDGNLYVASTTAIVVLAPDGKALGTIPVPRQPSNCTFGGADRKTLFITAQDAIYQVGVNVPGKP